MTHDEIKKQIQELLDKSKLVMEACMQFLEEQDKGGPGSGRKPGSGKPKDEPEKEEESDDYERAAEMSSRANEAIDKTNIPEKAKKDIKDFVNEQIAEAINMGSDIDKEYISRELYDQLGYTDMEHEEIGVAVDSILSSL